MRRHFVYLFLVGAFFMSNPVIGAAIRELTWEASRTTLLDPSTKPAKVLALLQEVVVPGPNEIAQIRNNLRHHGHVSGGTFLMSDVIEDADGNEKDVVHLYLMEKDGYREPNAREALDLFKKSNAKEPLLAVSGVSETELISHFTKRLTPPPATGLLGDLIKLGARQDTGPLGWGIHADPNSVSEVNALKRLAGLFSEMFSPQPESIMRPADPAPPGNTAGSEKAALPGGHAGEGEKPPRAAGQLTGNPHAATRVINALGFQLLRDLEEGNNDRNANTTISPLSIASAMGMALQGAEGETLRQLLNAMKITAETNPDKARDEFVKGYRALLESLRAHDKEDTLKLANALYVDGKPNQHFKHTFDTFQRNLIKHFQGDTLKLDPVKGALGTINGWVDDRTNHQIPSILTRPPGGPVLLSAAHFKDEWREKFDRHKTKAEDFATGDGKSTKVALMRRDPQRMAYMKNRTVEMVSIPFRGPMVMDVVLPVVKFNETPAQALERVKGELTENTYSDWVGDLNEAKVGVGLPKFTADYTAEKLTEILKKKAPSAFAPTADFSGMGLGQIHASEVAHKATMTADEGGAEGAAVTAIKLARVLAEHEQVDANRPFLYVLRDSTTNVVVFVGTMRRPPSP